MTRLHLPSVTEIHYRIACGLFFINTFSRLAWRFQRPAEQNQLLFQCCVIYSFGIPVIYL